MIGPVADDNIARLFGLYDMEIIDLDALAAGLIHKYLRNCLILTLVKIERVFGGILASRGWNIASRASYVTDENCKK